MKKIYNKYLYLFFIFIFYFIFGYYTHLYIPCIFHKITGLLCPGCGISRMIIAMFHGDFYKAFCYNKLLFVSSPIFVILFIDCVFSTFRNVKPLYMKIPKLVYYIYFFMLIAFGILRNIF